MYTYSKKLEDKLLAELHDEYNTGITYLPGVVAESKEEPEIIVNNFSETFWDSFMDLFSFAEMMLDGNCFPCMVNDANTKNAFAEKRHNIPIVGVHLAMVAECLSLAHAFALFDDYFVLERPIVRYDHKYFSPKIDDDGVFSFETAKSQEKRTLADMTAYLAVKFILLHELGHHNFNHLEKANIKRLSSLTDASEVKNSVSLQQLETEADMWATAKMLAGFEEIKECFVRDYSESISNLETVKILYMATLIPLLTVHEKITPQNMLHVDHPPSFIRHNDIKEVFVDALGINESLDNRLWNLIKDELLCDYERYEWMKGDFTEVLEKYELPWKDIDFMEKVQDDDADYVRYCIMNWMNDVFAYIVIRFTEMGGVGVRSMIDRNQKLIDMINQLSAEGIKLNKIYEIEA